MKYIDLFTPYHIALLHDWLYQVGELFLRLELPHSGGSGTSYSIYSLGEIKKAISQQTHPEIGIFIFKGKELDDDELDRRLNPRWVYDNSDLVLYIGVNKNRNYYEEYEKDPHKYKKAMASWAEYP